MRDVLRRFGRLWYGMAMRNWTRAILVKDDIEAHNMEMNSLFDIAGLTEVERGNGRALLQNDVSLLQALFKQFPPDLHIPKIHAFVSPFASRIRVE